MCPSRAWKFVDAEPVLTRYYHGRTSQLISLGRCSERIQYNWSKKKKKKLPHECIFVSASGYYCIYTNSPMYVPYWVSGQQIDLALIWQFRFGHSLVYRLLSKKKNTQENSSPNILLFFFCKTWYILIMVTIGHKVDMVIILWVCFVRVSVVSACDTSECMVV